MAGSCGNPSSGALTELAALGNQDAYLSINPEKTFFSQVYRRHTNFAIAEQDLTVENAPTGAWRARKVTARIQRNGDLLGWLYLSVTLSALGLMSPGPDDACSPGDPVTAQEARIFWTNAVGHALIDEVCFEVGSQVVDRWTGEFLQIWERFAGQPGKYLQEMIGQFDSEEDLRDFAAQDRRLYIPLPFYFCRAYALHKPLIALQYHEVRLVITVRGRSDLICRFRGGSDDTLINGTPCRDTLIALDYVTGGEMLDMVVTANYVYLDTMERRIMAQQPHEYLITQLQFHGQESVPAGTTSKQVQVHFNHPVLELFWVYQEDRQTDPEQCRYFNYGVQLADFLPHQDPDTAVLQLVDPFSTICLQINAHDRIAQREALYFRTVQPWERHTNIPDRFIYNYCFCLYPEEDWMPNGSLNMSRIDNVVFRFTFRDINGTGSGLENPGQVRIYARNHNVVKIAGGMLALRHAN